MSFLSAIIRAFSKKPKAEAPLGKEIKAKSVHYGRTPSSGLFTPSILKTAYDGVNRGDFDSMIELAHNMERFSFAWRSQLSTRKTTVIAQEIAIDGNGDGPEIKALRKLIESSEFRKLRIYLLDAIACGFAGVHITWHPEKLGKREIFMPKFHQRDQTNFAFEEGVVKRRKDSFLFKDLVDLEPYRWIIHTPVGSPGEPYATGIALAGAKHVMGLDMGFNAWLDAVDLATRRTYLVKMGESTPQSPEYRALLNAVAANLEAHSVAIAPPGTEVDIQGRDLGTLSTLFSGWQEWNESSIALLVNGQTMATMQGSSQAQSQTHRKVLQQTTEADNESCVCTINEQLIIPFLKINFGDKDYDIRLKAVIDDTEEKTAKMAAVLPFAEKFELGLKIKQITDAFGLESDTPDAPLQLRAANQEPAANELVPKVTQIGKEEKQKALPGAKKGLE